MNTIKLNNIVIHRVSDSICRGGRIGDAYAMNDLRVHGIKTVITLENDVLHTLKEEMWCHDFGINFIKIPMSEWERPVMPVLNKILNYIDRVPKPAYLH